MRAWWLPIANESWLQQWEFVLSKTEHEKFWLKKWEWNQISTAIKALEQAGYIRYTGRKIGNEQSKVYQFLINDLFVPIRMSGNDTGNERQKSGTDIGTNKENIEIEKKREVSARSVSLSDDDLLGAIEFFKKATKGSVRTRTWKQAQDIEYVKKIVEESDTLEIMDKLCLEAGSKCQSLEDKVECFAKALKSMLQKNTHRPRRLSSMKVIYDNFWAISNDF